MELFTEKKNHLLEKLIVLKIAPSTLKVEDLSENEEDQTNNNLTPLQVRTRKKKLEKMLSLDLRMELDTKNFITSLA